LFDDLHNSIQHFVNEIIEHLMELRVSCLDSSYEYEDLYITIIVPRNKHVILPIPNNENISHSNEKF